MRKIFYATFQFFFRQFSYTQYVQTISKVLFNWFSGLGEKRWTPYRDSWNQMIFIYRIPSSAKHCCWLWYGSFTSELQLEVNCRLKVNCRKIIGLVSLPNVDQAPAQILSYNSLLVYNSLSAAIHLYMIQARAWIFSFHEYHKQLNLDFEFWNCNLAEK